MRCVFFLGLRGHPCRSVWSQWEGVHHYQRRRQFLLPGYLERLHENGWLLQCLFCLKTTLPEATLKQWKQYILKDRIKTYSLVTVWSYLWTLPSHPQLVLQCFSVLPPVLLRWEQVRSCLLGSLLCHQHRTNLRQCSESLCCCTLLLGYPAAGPQPHKGRRGKKSTEPLKSSSFCLSWSALTTLPYIPYKGGNTLEIYHQMKGCIFLMDQNKQILILWWIK